MSPSLPPFSATVNGIQECDSVLSTSPGIRFPPPVLLLELAEKEAQTGHSDLTAAQYAGLRSLLGWTVDHQMAGPSAFLRHQCLTALYSEYVPKEVHKEDEENDKGQSTASWLPCLQRHWETYQYYSKERNQDQRLGELIMEKCGNATKTCSRKDCKFQIHSHQYRWVTGRTRIIAKLHPDTAPSEEGISMWISCHECGASTSRRPMGNGSWSVRCIEAGNLLILLRRLLSFGKYIELITYSDEFAKIHPPLCDHPKAASKEELNKRKFYIVRHFAFNSYIITFTAVPVEDVYEVRIPRVQITKHRALKAQREGSTIRDNWQEQDRDKLRLEITLWWKGVKEHMNQLEEILEDANGDIPLRKPLPPSPPLEREGTDEAVTPKASLKALPPLPNPSSMSATEHKHDLSSISSAATSSTTTSSLSLLSNLRQGFIVTEQALYTSLNSTPSTSINDARRLFYSAAKAASNRLSAWEKKHVPTLGSHIHYQEPEWWLPGYHALPRGSIIVKEDEWASIIAFTLSSSDYSSELIEMSKPRAASSIGAVAGSVAPTNSAISSASAATSESVANHTNTVETGVSPSLAAFVASMQVFSGSKPAPTLDPDDESQAGHWHVPESLSPQISRKDNPKEGSNILSLRDVLRNKIHAETASRLTNSGSATSNPTSKLGTKAPPSAFGSVSLELATHNAQGIVQLPTPAAVDVFEQILLDVEGDEDSLQTKTPTGTIKTKAPPVTSNSALGANPVKGEPSMLLPPPAVPPKDYRTPSTSAATTLTEEKTVSEATKGDSTSITSYSSTIGEIPFGALGMGSLTSTIANAMRYVLNVGQAYEDKPLPNTPHHGLLAMESPDIDSRPHIRYDCAVGKRLKFSCTVYYAKQFDSLRRRCGVDEVLIQSLKKTENWAAEGS
jgi:1-phosphatidylinositol-3-phosphate 5-kinase